MKRPKPVPKRYTEDFDWAWDHYSEWMKKYPDMWVAVADRKVIAASKDLGEVKKTAHSKIKR
jgi:hypothetical protein